MILNSNIFISKEKLIEDRLAEHDRQTGEFRLMLDKESDNDAKPYN